MEPNLLVKWRVTRAVDSTRQACASFDTHGETRVGPSRSTVPLRYSLVREESSVRLHRTGRWEAFSSICEPTKREISG
jgi:hypothetical protein